MDDQDKVQPDADINDRRQYAAAKSSPEDLLEQLLGNTILNQTHSTQEYNEEIAQYYMLIRTVVSACLSPDSEGLAEEERLSQAHSAIRLLQHSFQHVPDVVNYKGNSTSSSEVTLVLETESEKPKEDSKCRFDFWILSYLLNAIKDTSLQPIHDIIGDTICSLIDVTKGKLEDPLGFKVTFKFLVEITQEVLYMVSTKVRDSNFPCNLQLRKTKNLDSGLEAIQFRTETEASTFLVNLFHTIAKILKKNSQFFRDLKGSLWRITITQLKLYDNAFLVPVTQGITNLISSLIKGYKSIPLIHIEDLLYHFLLRIYHLLISKNPNTIEGTEDIIFSFDLQDQVAACLKLILEYLTAPATLFSSISLLKDLVISKDFIQFSTPDLMNAIFNILEVLVYLMEYSQIKECTDALITILGSNKPKQALTNCLIKMCKVQGPAETKSLVINESKRKSAAQDSEESSELQSSDNKRIKITVNLTGEEATLVEKKPANFTHVGYTGSFATEHSFTTSSYTLKKLIDIYLETVNRYQTANPSSIIVLDDIFLIQGSLEVLSIALDESSVKDLLPPAIQFGKRYLRDYTRLFSSGTSIEPECLLSCYLVMCQFTEAILRAFDNDLKDQDYTTIKEVLLCILIVPWLKDVLGSEDIANKIPEELAQEEAIFFDLLKKHFDIDKEKIYSAESLTAIGSSELQGNIVSLMPLFKDVLPYLRSKIYSFCLSKSADVSVRITAWKHLALFLNTLDRDDTIKRLIFVNARVELDDPPQLLQAVADSIGHVACVESEDTKMSELSNRRTRRILKNIEIQCHKCDSSDSNSSIHEESPKNKCTISEEDWRPYIFLLSNRQTTETRLGFMKSIYRILNHIPTHELNLNQSTIGKSCLKSLTSSQHRLRLLASRSLMKFFPDARCEQKTILRENSQILKEHFSQLINSDHSEYQEIYIATLRNLSKVADKTLLSYILQVLLESLGHKNLFVRTLAYQAIKTIAKFRDVTELELFKPFWSDLSIFIIEKLESKVDLVKQVVTMFRMSIKDFLDQTLEHTLPYLVFKKKVETLEALAKILDRDVPVMCINEIHHILGFLFMQEESDIHEAIMFFLSIASSDFNNITMTSLLKSCSLLLVVKLAIELGDEEEGRRLKALAALRLVESKLRNEIPQDSNISEDSLSTFLRHYFLGVLSHINESINDLHGNQSSENKLKTVRSLGSLINLIGHSVYPMTPQIMATLQTILDHPSLRTEALKVWKIFIHILDLEHLGPLLNQIIVILINAYTDSSGVERNEIVIILNYLFVEKREQLQQHFHTVRQLPDIPEFGHINSILGELKGNVTIREQLEGVLELIVHENPIVVHQALAELKRLLDENQNQVYSLILAETVDPLVNDIIRTLLETCTRFNGSNFDIQLISAECLGIVGAVDPGRLDISLTEESMIVVNNFEDADESIDFVCNFIEKQLVGAFRSARDTKLQSHLAFTIQELLKFCGFSSELISESPRAKINGRVRRRWNSFPRTVHETITPLLDAKYSINYISNKVYNYPIYPVKQYFKEWLQSWTMNLISKVNGENARKIFSVCRNIVKTGNTNIALYLLPHLVLNVLISGNDIQRDEILTEVLSVLKDNSNCKNQQPSEKQQLGAQVWSKKSYEPFILTYII
ncbi:hypothetical protein K7432_005656 [Basidiobolus ranarum]|uniref:non-specific serine/threonine protein kinase n=1 Tax=Basidiobolus ranarum TaxID=34480 RepID=A0ABR2W2U7_9FUNG